MTMPTRAFWSDIPEAALWRPEDVRPSAWTAHVPFAFWIVEALRPRFIVELGTWYGMSYLAFCQAIAKLGIDGKAMAVDTWQGDHQTGKIAANALASLRQAHDPKYGKFSTLNRITFNEAASQVPDKSVDLLHIDGLHTYEAVREDFNTWLPKMSGRGVILFHDTQETHADFGVYQLWAELAAKYPYFEFKHEHGLGVLGVGSEYPQAIQSLFAVSGDAEAEKRVQGFFERLGVAVRGEQTQDDLAGQLEKIVHLPEVRATLKVRRVLGLH